MKNQRFIEIDEKLMACIAMIWKDIQNNDVVCSSDLYQNDVYCGGFEGDLADISKGEFTFGKYEMKLEVLWISIPFNAIQGIIKGDIKKVLAYDPE